ncbi:hypothetical protein BN997_02953 [Oceanobacillus oncorhynchi]|uniref:Uncharacterized protein n=1 Tax=Oceanobacillus oncorhynchi TaxID=545501 RepID=A0A0A1MTQ2_9BACI|nr:hypothetical protein BN997_02953 [Oceanobacillus oncorhynchi]
MKVLVIGANGQIGKHFVTQLQNIMRTGSFKRVV